MERKQKGYRLLPPAIDAVKKDAEARGVGEAELLEMILAAYYDLPELLADPQRIQQARVLLRIAEARDDTENARDIGKEKR